MAATYRDRRMHVPIEKLYQAITDFESYPQFVSEVVGVKLLSKEGSTKPKVEFELEVVKRFQYTLEFSLEKPTKVSWKLVESNFFKKNDGAWVLTADGNETNARYELDVAFGFMVPSWVSKKLTEVNLPKMMENFEKRALSL